MTEFYLILRKLPYIAASSLKINHEKRGEVKGVLQKEQKGEKDRKKRKSASSVFWPPAPFGTFGRHRSGFSYPFLWPAENQRVSLLEILSLGRAQSQTSRISRTSLFSAYSLNWTELSTRVMEQSTESCDLSYCFLPSSTSVQGACTQHIPKELCNASAINVYVLEQTIRDL